MTDVSMEYVEALEKECMKSTILDWKVMSKREMNGLKNCSCLMKTR